MPAQPPLLQTWSISIRLLPLLFPQIIFFFPPLLKVSLGGTGLKSKVVYFLLKDRTKHKWTQQKASKCSAASWGEILAVDAGYLPRGGTAKGRTRCPLGWVPPRRTAAGLPQAGSGSWGWWADSIPLVRVGERQAQMSTVPGCSPCHAALGVVTRKVLHPWGCGAPCRWDAVCPPPARHTTADLLLSRSLQGQRRHRALGEEKGLLQLEAGQGARQMLVLHEPWSSEQRLRVTGLWRYFRCCWDVPTSRATRKEPRRGWGTPKPVELHCTTREAETHHNYQFQTQRSHTWIRPLSVSVYGGGPSAGQQTLSCPFLAQERHNKQRGALDDINFTFCSRIQQTKESLQR